MGNFEFPSLWCDATAFHIGSSSFSCTFPPCHLTASAWVWCVSCSSPVVVKGPALGGSRSYGPGHCIALGTPKRKKLVTSALATVKVSWLEMAYVSGRLVK
jgi:hypothetical protein